MALIRSWDNSNCVFALAPCSIFNHNPQQAAFNSGTAYPYQGPSGGAITATLTNMLSGYGYNQNPWFRFDGVDDYIATNYKPFFTNSSVHTFEAKIFWVANALRYLFGTYDDGSNFWGVYGNTDGTIKGRFVIGGAVRDVASVDTLSTGWNTVTLTKNGGTLQLYINGSEVSYSTQNTYNLGNKIYTNAMSFGKLNAYAAGPFDGLISWASVYETALTSGTILDNYNNLGQLFDGIRGSISGSNLVLRDPDDDAPALPGGATKFGDSAYWAPITFRAEASPSSETHVPVVLHEHHIPDSCFDNCSQADGSDLIITTEAGVEIPIEVVAFSKASKTCTIWIKIPTITANTDVTILWQCGGSAGQRTYTAADVWANCYGGSTDYITVHHLEESSGNAIDSAGNYDGTVSGATQGATGQVEKGYDFDAVTEYVNLGNVSETSGAAKLTGFLWLSLGALDVLQYILRQYNDADELFYLISETPSTGTLGVHIGASDGTVATGVYYYANDGFLVNQQTLLSFVFDGTQTGNADRLKILQNAINKSLTFTNNVPAQTGVLSGSALTLGYSTNSLNGIVDEFRLIAGALTANQIATHYYNERGYDVNISWDIGEATLIPVGGGGVTARSVIGVGVFI